VTQKKIASFAIGWEESHTDGDGEVRIGLAVKGNGEFFDGGAQALGPGVGAVCGGVGENEGELFAALPTRDVFGANAGFEDVGDGLQRGVSGEMAVGVIEALEVVDVDHQHGEGLFAAHRPGEFALH
jgi:hypothetical protein